eukprot:m.56456 g.56456  ORF g.56456 m.56456 type:complete len:220 (-) comp6768_c0_seq2:241-900(-)
MGTWHQHTSGGSSGPSRARPRAVPLPAINNSLLSPQAQPRRFLDLGPGSRDVDVDRDSLSASYSSAQDQPLHPLHHPHSHPGHLGGSYGVYSSPILPQHVYASVHGHTSPLYAAPLFGPPGSMPVLSPASPVVYPPFQHVRRTAGPEVHTHSAMVGAGFDPFDEGAAMQGPAVGVFPTSPYAMPRHTPSPALISPRNIEQAISSPAFDRTEYSRQSTQL